MNYMKQKNMRAMHNTPGNQTGFSLIELMIASVIGLVILGGAVTVFSTNSASSKLSTGMARIQDNGRVALDIISYSTRMAGYEGCRDEVKDPAIVLATVAPTVDLRDGAIWGSEVDTGNSWDPARPADLNPISGRVKADTDVFYIQHGSGRTSTLAADMASSSADILLPLNPDQFATNDMLMISNCETTEIFRATDVDDNAAGQTVVQHGTSANIQSNFNTVYTGTGDRDAVPVRVMRFEASAYFIGDSNRDTPNGDSIFSLFVRDTTTGTTTELVEGVENLQVLYGENVQPDPELPPLIRYVTADAVTNFANVLSVQLGLLIATADYAASDNDNRVYNIAGTTVGPDASSNDQHQGDRRLRAAFNTTIQLRNRTIQE